MVSELYVKLNSKQLQKAKSDPLQRIYAKIVDAIIFLPSFVISIMVISPEEDNIVVLFIINLILIFIFNVIIPFKTEGQTLGKSFVGLRIIKSNSTKCEFKTYLLRYSYTLVIALIAMVTLIGRPIAGLISLISLILLFTDDHSQTLQDKYAKTYVVNDELHIRLQKTNIKMRKAKIILQQKELEQ